jgi:hypothetical protein
MQLKCTASKSGKSIPSLKDAKKRFGIQKSPKNGEMTILNREMTITLREITLNP